VCAAPDVCTPRTCQANQCGMTSDGCGGTLACGGCPNPKDSCVNGVCQCVPDRTCSSPVVYQCGSLVDKCGTVHTCGPKPTTVLVGSCPTSFGDGGTLVTYHEGCPACDGGSGAACSTYLAGPTPPEPTWVCSESNAPLNTWCCSSVN
jgi:hypothetical protein